MEGVEVRLLHLLELPHRRDVALVAELPAQLPPHPGEVRHLIDEVEDDVRLVVGAVGAFLLYPI